MRKLSIQVIMKVIIAMDDGLLVSFVVLCQNINDYDSSFRNSSSQYDTIIVPGDSKLLSELCYALLYYLLIINFSTPNL